MTATHHGQPVTQVGGHPDPFVTGAPPTQAAAPPGANWPYPAPLRPHRGGSKLSAIGIGAAIVIAIAALVVGIIDLMRPAPSAAPVAPSASSAPPRSAPADYTVANKALCTAIAPLMGESDRTGKAFTNLGPPDSAASAAAVPKFVKDTKDWVGRIQPIIDSHSDVDPYFQRTLQRFVDDQRNLATDLGAGPWQPYDMTIWNDGLGAENGPMSTCWALGVKW